MMGKQNIAIRGHVPEESNVHVTISLIALIEVEHAKSADFQ